VRAESALVTWFTDEAYFRDTPALSTPQGPLIRRWRSFLLRCLGKVAAQRIEPCGCLPVIRVYAQYLPVAFDLLNRILQQNSQQGPRIGIVGIRL
jgi:hypothetical protein